MLKFSIIIVTWNGLKLLKKFLPSVAKTEYTDYEIILADNASTDGTQKWVKENFAEIKVVRFNKNYGFCDGNNKAVPYASGDILVFLNNDVRVNKNWLNPIAATFKSDEGIAVVQPKILSHREPLFFEYAGGAGGFIDKYGYPFAGGAFLKQLKKIWGNMITI